MNTWNPRPLLITLAVVGTLAAFLAAKKMTELEKHATLICMVVVLSRSSCRCS